MNYFRIQFCAKVPLACSFFLAWAWVRNLVFPREDEVVVVVMCVRLCCSLVRVVPVVVMWVVVWAPESW